MTDSGSDTRTIICVTGMHCSGTSATARIVNLLGVDFGPPEVGSQTYRSNRKGLWELPALRRISQDVMALLGTDWDDPRVLEPGWEAAPELEDLRIATRDLVERTFGASPLWGWKDPRTALLLPFWRSALGPMRVVICVRHPMDVVASLADWDGFDRDKSLELWLRYTSDAAAAIGHDATIVTRYEDLLRGGAAYARLADFVGLPGADETPAFRSAAAEFIDRDMRHSRSSDDHPLDSLPASVRVLYERLVSSAR